MLADLPTNTVLLMVLAALWTLPWKGYALWRAARIGDTWWFIALLVLNTLAILDIIYIFLLAPKRERAWREKQSAQ